MVQPVSSPPNLLILVLYIFVSIFGVDRAQTTIDFNMFFSKSPLVRYSTVV